MHLLVSRTQDIFIVLGLAFEIHVFAFVIRNLVGPECHALHLLVCRARQKIIVLRFSLETHTLTLVIRNLVILKTHSFQFAI